jgi:hypothetical protein
VGIYHGPKPSLSVKYDENFVSEKYSYPEIELRDLYEDSPTLF